MHLMDSAAPEPAPSPGKDGAEERGPAASAPARAETPIEVTFLKQPPVVLTDPPAIFGGASHTW